MSDLDTAALKLAGFALACLLVLFAAWWVRRPRPDPAAPKIPKARRIPTESRFPKLSRKVAVEQDAIEMAPSRLARISAKSALDRLNETADDVELAPDLARKAEPAFQEESVIERPAPADAGLAPPAIDEAILETLASKVEEQAHLAPASSPTKMSVRLAPQIPPCDPILRKSWLGGRPKLPAAMEWPKVNGTDGDFLAQIACADLPAGLWEGLGPRSGSLAFFAEPDTGEAIALHLTDDGTPRDPPRSRVGAAYFLAYGNRAADLAPLAIRAFPEWPVDVVSVRPDEQSPAHAESGTVDAWLAADYDLADPAFHPFDWDSMLAMAAILESRLAILPTDGVAPADANDELTLAIADAAETNREAHARADEIIAIIRESAGQGTSFSPSDATAVMAGLHAIRWTSVSSAPDPENGEDLVETLALPLTRHHPDADLWVDDYRNILFDHAKHAWCNDPGRLSAPARAFFEPVWEAMATREMASMGNFPSLFVAGFDDERDAVLLELPASGLMSRSARTGGNLVLAIRKTDLAIGDFSKLRALAST